VGTPAGTITPPSAVVNDGATTAFTLTADPGFHIDTVTGTCPAGSLAGNTYTTGAITADCTVVANFAADSGGSPVASVTPTSLSYTLAAGASASNPLTISNTGGGTLTWSITEAAAKAPVRANANAGQTAGRGTIASTGRTPRANPQPMAVVINEGFEDVATLLSTGGWLTANHSSPVGASTWSQCGGTAIPPSFDGDPNSCALVNFNSTTGAGTISNWLLTPEITFNAGATASFYTKAPGVASFPDRLEVRVCSSGDCTNFGTGATDVGNYTTLLLSINPNLVAADDPTGANGYPAAWTQFNLTGLPTSGTGRIAFRYFVTDGGPSGNNSNIIGLDRLVVDNGGGGPTGCASPSDVPWLSASDTSGSIAGGASNVPDITVNAASLAAGSYSAHVCVATNDPGNALVDVPVSVTVTGGGTNPPSATVAPGSLSLTVQEDETGSATLNIANAAGSDPLTYSIAALGARPHLVPRPMSRTERAAHRGGQMPMGSRMVRGSVANGTSHAGSPWAPVGPDGSVTFQADDGSYENAIAWTDGTTQNVALWLNRYAATGALTIDTVSIEWPDAAAANGDVTGKQVNLLAYYDADADGDPSNAVRLGSDTLVTIAGPSAFENYATSFAVPGAGDVYLGFADTFATGGTTPTLYAAAVDESGDPSVGWAAAMSTGDADLNVIGNNDAIGTLDGLSGGTLSGVWMIRGTASGAPTGCTGTPVGWLSATPSSGTVAGGSNTDVTVTADPSADSLAPGSYNAALCITTNDPTQATIEVPVSLTVTAAPFVPCSGGSDEIFCDGFDGSGGGGGPATYTDRTTFLQNVAAGYYENDFADAVPGPSDPLNYTSGSWAYTVSASSDQLYNDTGLISTNLAADQIVVTFTGAAVTAVGGNFWSTDISVTPTGTDTTLSLSDGTVETFTSTGPTDFRGFTTAGAVTSLTVEAPDDVVTAWPTMDNLIVGAAN
jgi:hypothetical protein